MSTYKKSSYCANSTCFEVSNQNDDPFIHVRGGLPLRLSGMVVRVYTGDEVAAFVKGVQNGEFDLDETPSVPVATDNAQETELGASAAEQADEPGDVTYADVALGSLRLLLLTDNRQSVPATIIKDGDPPLSFSPQAWVTFIQGVKNGALDSFTA
ncbi:MAG: hypothetical protein JNK33_06090 [Candidatus Doudnabacteria bacterium]|nr:hypothetical protein [Candidatus Doudnabacteria bacterium]